MKKITLFLLLISALSLSAQEVVNTGSLIQAGIEDGSKLVNAYITPLNKAIVYGLSDVTYSKIKKDQPHNLSFSVKMAYVSVPDEDLSFDVYDLDLQNLEPKDPAQHITPTVFGDSLAVITLVSKQKDLLGRPLIEFDTPGGGESSALPLPFLSATYHMDYTNLNVDFIPYITIPSSDLSIGLIGVSIQQDLGKFIKSLDDSPFGISIQTGFSYLFGDADLHVEPDGIYSPVTPTGETTGPYDNQKLNIGYTSLNFGAYADYNLTEKISLFAGAGYNIGGSSIEINGTYPVYTADPSGSGSVIAEDVDDPLSLTDTYSRAKFDFGARADFNRFFVQVNYNIATYGGFGLNLGYKML